MAITKWSPMTDIMPNIREMQRRIDRMFSDFFSPAETDEDFVLSRWSPSVDIVEKDDSFIVEAELPGMTKDDIKVSVSNNVLTIKGEKKSEKEKKGESYYRAERLYGTFSRSFALPQTVRSDKIDAHFKDGVLTVTVPKAEEAKAREVEVKIK